MKYITLDRIILVAGIIFLLCLVKCQREKTLIAESVVTELQLKNQELDSIKNLQDQVIYTQTVLETLSQKSIKDLTDSMFNLKTKYKKDLTKVLAYYSSTSKTEVKDKQIPYLDTGKMKKFSDSIEASCREVLDYYRKKTVEVPKTVYDSSKHFVFSGQILKNGFNVNKVTFPDSTYLRFAEKKGGLFKKNYTEVQVLHTNPYVTVTSSNSVIYKSPPKSRIIERVLIFAGGVLLGSKL